MAVYDAARSLKQPSPGIKDALYERLGTLDDVCRRGRGLMFTMDDREVQLLLELKDPRVVPTLMDRIARHGAGTTIHVGNTAVAATRGDLAMAIILRQTGQSLKEYGFHVERAWPGAAPTYGFDKDAKRKAARKKLRAWWQKHKKEYADVPRIDLTRRADRTPSDPETPDVPEESDE